MSRVHRVSIPALLGPSREPYCGIPDNVLLGLKNEEADQPREGGGRGSRGGFRGPAHRDSWGCSST